MSTQAAANTSIATVTKDSPPAANPAIDGPAFSSVRAAIDAIRSGSRTNITIVVYPGTYEETIVLPDTTTLQAQSSGTVTMSQSNIVRSVDIVTMGNNTKVSGVNVQGTLGSTVQAYAIVRGVVFPGATSVNSRLEQCTISMQPNNTVKADYLHMYGIHTEGGGKLPVGNTIIDNVTSSCSCSGLLTITNGLYNTGPTTYIAANSTFVANIATKAIAIDSTNASASVTIKDSSADGDTADISQTKGVLALSGTTLHNSTANGLDFTVLDGGYTFVLSYKGPLLNQSGWMAPGSTTLQQATVQNAPKVYIGSRTVGKSFRIKALKAAGSGGKVQVDLYKNNTLTLSSSISDNATDSTASTSTTLQVNDYISFFLSGTGVSEDITVQLQIY